MRARAHDIGSVRAPTQRAVSIKDARGLIVARVGVGVEDVLRYAHEVGLREVQRSPFVRVSGVPHALHVIRVNAAPRIRG